MKTIVGLFDDFAQAKNAALEVEKAGIAHNDISVVANNESGQYAPTTPTPPTTETTGAAITHDAVVGAEIGGVAGLLMGLTAIAIPGFGWIAGAGWLMGMLMGAGVGALAGGLIGALTHAGVPEEEAAYYHEGVRRGGTLVAVKAEDTQAARVAQILSAHGAVNIDERASTYRNEGFVPSTATGTGPSLTQPEGSIPGIQTGGHALDGTPDTRGVTEKVADAVTGDRIDDKTGKAV